MEMSKLISPSNTKEKILEVLQGIPTGQGYTKQELSEKLGFTSEAVVEKWMKRYPEINNHKVYIKVSNGHSRIAVFVNLEYKHQLILNGSAQENY